MCITGLRTLYTLILLRSISMTIYKPYTYWLFHKPSRKFYYGSRTAKFCSPAELFDTYFSSSLVVKRLISEDGMDSFRYRVDKTFNSAAEALEYEYTLLKKFKAGNNPRFLNKHHTKSILWTPALREKASRTHKNKIKNGEKTNAFKKGHAPTVGFTGRKHSPATIELFRNQRKGVNNVSCRDDVKEKRRAQFLTNNPAKNPAVREKLKLKAQERRNRRACCIVCGKEMSEPGLASHIRGSHSTSDLFHRRGSFH